MINIEPTQVSSLKNPLFMSAQDQQFSGQQVSVSNDSKNSKTLLLSTTALAIMGVTTVLLGKRSKITYEEALKKNGVQIKDGIATLIETGEKYTGSIKRNIRAFGLKQETVNFENGVITEKLYHTHSGKELEGEFYKDGIKRVKVSKDIDPDSTYVRYLYSADGNIICRSDCTNRFQDKFNKARELLKDM